MARKSKAVEGQCALFDLSHYSQAELTGSFSDDFESEAVVKNKGKKSKICPTWLMNDRELEAHRLTYREKTIAIVKGWPPATAQLATAIVN